MKYSYRKLGPRLVEQWEARTVSKQLADLSKTEWKIMDALWTRGRATATELQRDLFATQRWAYSTVKTMLDRLVDKGYARTRRVGNVYEYSPKIKRPVAVMRVIDDVVDRILSGSAGSLVQRLIEQKRLTDEEAARLREMLERYQEQQ